MALNPPVIFLNMSGDQFLNYLVTTGIPEEYELNLSATPPDILSQFIVDSESLIGSSKVRFLNSPTGRATVIVGYAKASFSSSAITLSSSDTVGTAMFGVSFKNECWAWDLRELSGDFRILRGGIYSASSTWMMSNQLGFRALVRTGGSYETPDSKSKSIDLNSYDMDKGTFDPQVPGIPKLTNIAENFYSINDSQLPGLPPFIVWDSYIYVHLYRTYILLGRYS